MSIRRPLTDAEAIRKDWYQNGLVNSDQDYDELTESPWLEQLLAGVPPKIVVKEYMAKPDWVAGFATTLEYAYEPMDAAGRTIATAAYEEGLVKRISGALQDLRGARENPAGGGCDKCRASATGSATCDECGKAYVRCDKHGGGDGARRSLKSHKGLYHPKTVERNPSSEPTTEEALVRAMSLVRKHLAAGDKDRAKNDLYRAKVLLEQLHEYLETGKSAHSGVNADNARVARHEVNYGVLAREMGMRENPGRSAMKKKLAFGDTTIETWFERDRAHVELRRKSDDSTIVEWWDEDVQQAVEDGFLKPGSWHRTAYEYADEMGLLYEDGKKRRNPPGEADLRLLVKSPKIAGELAKAIKQCETMRGNQLHTHVDELLGLVNQAMDAHGIESLQPEGAHVDGYYRNIILLYVNTGDPYVPTLMFDTDKSKFLVGGWGDFLEQWEKER